MRVVLAGGGTGGHVYPALSVAEALHEQPEVVDLLYLGTAQGAEARLVPRAGIPFRSIPAGQMRGTSPQRAATNGMLLGRGTLAARRALRDFGADAVFATGGYASVPVCIAARLERLPLIVFLPDVYPGWAVRLAVRLATRVATTAAGALRHLPAAKTVVTGYPLRREFWHATREEGRRRLELDTGPVLLVTGGSQGSVALNAAVLQALPALLELCEIVQVTGPHNETAVLDARAHLPAAVRLRHHVYGYLSGIAWAMAAADLALMRAGASCLAEPAATGLPTILVPGTYAGAHQRLNAEFMQAQGAAVALDESRLPLRLPGLVRALLTSPARLKEMSAAARGLARPSAAQELAALVAKSQRTPTASGARL